MADLHCADMSNVPPMDTTTTPFRYFCFISQAIIKNSAEERTQTATSASHPALEFQLTHECKQKMPTDVARSDLDLETGFKAAFYLKFLCELHKTDLLKTFTPICTECQGPSRNILYLQAYQTDTVKVIVLPLCSAEPCIMKYQSMDTFDKLMGDSTGIPIIALFPFEVAGKARCLGCGKESVSEKQRSFRMAKPRPHLKVFAHYAVCECGVCRAEADRLRMEDFIRYGAGMVNCHGCGRAGATSVCGGCGLARYCGKECQKKHWKDHKTDCRARRTSV